MHVYVIDMNLKKNFNFSFFIISVIGFDVYFRLITLLIFVSMSLAVRVFYSNGLEFVAMVLINKTPALTLEGLKNNTDR